MILASNRGFGQWGRDLRRLHHRHRDPRPAPTQQRHLDIKGESYRRKEEHKAGVLKQPVGSA